MTYTAKEEKLARIQRAIVRVRRKAASIPSSMEADERAIRAAEKRVKLEVKRELGGRFWFGSDGKYHLQLANVSASCADDGAALFRRWQIDASRKILMMKVVAA